MKERGWLRELSVTGKGVFVTARVKKKSECPPSVTQKGVSVTADCGKIFKDPRKHKIFRGGGTPGRFKRTGSRTFAANKKTKVMKQITKIFLCALAGASILPSCKKNLAVREEPVPGDMAVLTVGLEGAEASVVTRAGTDASGSDKTVSSVQFFFFEPGGNCAGKLEAAGSITLLRGYKYTVAALVNGPAVTVSTFTALKAASIDLKDNPFVMYGELEADLTTEASKTVAVSVSSLGSRVRVVQIKNNLPSWAGSITVSKVFLCNVVGTAVPAGTEQDIKYNWYGRSDRAINVSQDSGNGSVKPSDPAGAYTCFESGAVAAAGASLTGLPKSLYCFPNSSRKEMENMYGNTSIDQDASTWLSVMGTAAGKNYFWTVNLGKLITETTGLAANYTYDVSIIINNFGSTDPGTPMTPGSLTVSCTPRAWTDGGNISAEI